MPQTCVPFVVHSDGARVLLNGAHHNNVGKQADSICIEVLADFLPPFHDVLQHPN